MPEFVADTLACAREGGNWSSEIRQWFSCTFPTLSKKMRQRQEITVKAATSWAAGQPANWMRTCRKEWGEREKREMKKRAAINLHKSIWENTKLRSRGDEHDRLGRERCIVSAAPNGNAFRVLSKVSQWTRRGQRRSLWGVAGANAFKFWNSPWQRNFRRSQLNVLEIQRNLVSPDNLWLYLSKQSLMQYNKNNILI